MKIAILSDIHANKDAFHQVLIDIGKSSVDAVFCLGDNIGYGPEPEETLHILRSEAIPSVLGNHEMACVHRSMLKWFNPAALESLQKTIRMLSPDSLKFIEGLKESMVSYGCRFVHGFPPDSPTVYLFQVSQKKIFRFMSQMTERICFIGHTHELKIIEFDGKKCVSELLRMGFVQLKEQNRYIINVGSVGQPRDGDKRAKYLIWDNEKDVIEVRFIPYDIEKVIKKIMAAGLPAVHANRLR